LLAEALNRERGPEAVSGSHDTQGMRAKDLRDLRHDALNFVATHGKHLL
jgi:hypothetical protein